MNSREIQIPAVPARTAYQTIAKFSVHTELKSIEVVLITKDSETEEQIGALDIHNFNGDRYDEIMSEFPSWSPQKPADVFRPDDLFSYIDYLEGNEND